MRSPLINFVVLMLAGFLLPALAHAQMTGTYTCAAGNPGGAFAYGDIGDFFNDLEANGVQGAVTLLVFDDGGPFASTPDYALGLKAVGHGVAGLANGSLSIKPAPGERPIIVGTGASHVHTSQSMGTLTFVAVSNVNVEGLEIRGGSRYGICFHAPLAAGIQNNIRIGGCRIHDMADSNAICVTGSGSQAFFNSVIVENNMLWNLRGNASGAPLRCALCFTYIGVEWIVRHNTIVVTQTLSMSGVVMTAGSGRVDEFTSNVVYLANGVEISAIWSTSMSGLPLYADYNTYYTGPGVFFGPSYSWTFQDWQAAGFDPNGQFIDPELVNVTPGFEDLRLRPTSPARDFSPLLGVSTDIEGQPRPQGLLYDGGADEYWPPEPIISLEYAWNPVPLAANLNVGPVGLNGATRTFTIRNLGTAALDLTGAPPVGLTHVLNCNFGTIVQTPPAVQVPPGGSTTFTVFIEPLAQGPIEFTLSIDNNAMIGMPFSFTVSATGVPPNQPARAVAMPGSAFTGPPGGPYSLELAPGAALANATLQLEDPEADTITVTLCDPVGAPMAGLTGPPMPLPGQPLVLSWTGIADPANPPGLYAWRIEFADSVNQLLVVCDLHFKVLDLAPTHQPAGALGGDGSPGLPYGYSFNRGDDAGAVVDLCAISDPNLGQSAMLGAVMPSPGNPGTVGFDFALSGGLLRVSPAGLLTMAEVGQHGYTVPVSDGTNVTLIHVSLGVGASPMAFTTPSPLPNGTVDAPYSVTLAVSGAVGAVTFTLVSGQLPPGLSLDSTGLISGTPSQIAAANFTVMATDSTAAIATGALQLSIFAAPPPPPPPPPPPDTPGAASSSGGCTTGTAAIWPLLALMCARRRRDD